jgi:hypothetical protein
VSYTVIEPIDEMPPGTLGLRASGKLTKADYRDVLEPALHRALGSGELRLLFVLTDFEGLEPGAWIDDVKTGLDAFFRHHSAWKRFALVTDVDWVAKSTRMFAWMIPGETSIFDLDHIEDAKTWVSG